MESFEEYKKVQVKKIEQIETWSEEKKKEMKTHMVACSKSELGRGLGHNKWAHWNRYYCEGP